MSSVQESRFPNARAGGASPFAEIGPNLIPAAAELPRPALWRRMLRQQRSHWYGILAGIELALMAMAVMLAHWTCTVIGVVPAGAQHGLLLVFGIWASMIALGLYQRHSMYARELHFGTATRVVAALGVGGSVSLFAGVVDGLGSGGAMLGFSLVYSGLAILGSRRLFDHLVAQESWRRRTLFLGAGVRAASVAERLHSEEATPLMRSLQVVGFVPLASDRAAMADGRRLRLDGSLASFTHQQEVDEIVVVSDGLRHTLPLVDLVSCRLTGVEILDLDGFYEREFGKTALELIQPSWCMFSRSFDTSALRLISKRAFDLGTTILLVLLTWPLMLMVALAILIESRGRGPVLYAQERVGHHGPGFRLLKFRSMRTDAEIDGVARWAESDDNRITGVGRVIRKLRLDELPQLWNVLKGDMSIVGPRPERPQFVEGFIRRVPHYSLRHCVRPGLAGWAQLRFPYGASEADAIEKLRYDLYYVKFQSLRFDLLILLQTVEVVIFGRGAR